MATIAIITLNGVQYEVEDEQARRNLEGKQDVLTFDLTPLVNSSNPVTSDGIARSIADFITANVSNLVNYYTKTEIDAKMSPVYKAAGSCASVSALGNLDASHEGFVYDMSAEFTTTSDFKDYASQGAKTFPAGTQVAIINVGTAQSPTYKYDTLSGFLDMSSYATKEEIENVPDFIEEELSTDIQNEYTRLLLELYQAIADAANAKADYVGTDNYVYHWDAVQGQYVKTSIYVKGDPGTTDYNLLRNKPDIPDELADLEGDSTHRVVTDVQIANWNAKQNHITDLETIRSGAAAGATAYQKPSNGIPASDFASSVQQALLLAASAVQLSQLAAVATSGSYNDLTDKPDIPNVEFVVDSSSSFDF